MMGEEQNVTTQHRRLNTPLFCLLPGLVWACLMVLACTDKPLEEKGSPPLPADLRSGEARFMTSCAGCHGNGAIGTDRGPPLVHKIYEPSHHGDAAFYRAATNGVRAHHWHFGDMPKIEGVTSEDLSLIVQYVRWLQRQAGIR